MQLISRGSFSPYINFRDRLAAYSDYIYHKYKYRTGSEKSLSDMNDQLTSVDDYIIDEVSESVYELESEYYIDDEKECDNIEISSTHELYDTYNNICTSYETHAFLNFDFANLSVLEEKSLLDNLVSVVMVDNADILI